MTLTDALADVELIVLTEDDLAVECDAPTCEARATWSWRCEGCGFVILSCNPHRAQLDEENAQYHIHGAWLYCLTCKTEVPDPIRWLPL